MSNIIAFPTPKRQTAGWGRFPDQGIEVIHGSPPCQAFAPRPKVPLYNVYKGKELAYGSGTFAQCTRFMAIMMGDESGVVTVGEAVRAGYTLKALA